jgi:hypothetical protein
MYNLTMIGSTPVAGQHFTPTSPKINSGRIQMRSGFAGLLQSAVVVNTGTQPALDVDPAATGCPGQNTTDNLIACTIEVCASTFDGAALAPEDQDALDCCTLAAPNNNCTPGAFPGLVNEDVTFNPIGNGGKLDSTLKPATAKIKPKISPASPLCGTTTLPAPSTVTFRGAFAGTAPTLWAEGWTALGKAGLLSATAAGLP